MERRRRRRNYSIHCFRYVKSVLCFIFLENMYKMEKRREYKVPTTTIAKEKIALIVGSVQRHWKTISWTNGRKKILFSLVRWCAFRSSGICCHASFKYKSFSRSFIYHRVNVYTMYHPPFFFQSNMFAWISIFRFEKMDEIPNDCVHFTSNNIKSVGLGFFWFMLVVSLFCIR